jgi:copper transport protein
VKRLVFLLACVIALMLITPGVAMAHAALINTNPPDGAELTRAPAAVSLTFDEPVDIELGAVQVFGPGGARADIGDVTHGTHASATVSQQLAANLAHGTYTVAWRVVSDDSHPVSGVFTFSIGAPTTAAATVPTTTTNWLVADAFASARFTAYAAFALLIGGAAFLTFCWPTGRTSRAARRVITTGWYTLFAGTLAALVLQGPFAEGKPIAAALDPTLISATLATRLGATLVTRVALLGVAIWYLAWLYTTRPLADNSQNTPPPTLDNPSTTTHPHPATPTTHITSQAHPDNPPQTTPPIAHLSQHPKPLPHLARHISGAIIAIALAATWSLSGHAAEGSLIPLSVAADLAHLLAMATWVGGLAMLTVVLLRRHATAPTPDRARAVAVFSPIAFWCVAALAVTGTYQAIREVGSWSALVDTGYGRLLLAKAAGFAILIILGAKARTVLSRRTGATTTFVRLRVGVAAEFGIALVVLGVTATLVGAAPATTPANSNPHSGHTGHVHNHITFQTHEVDFTSGPQTGTVTVLVAPAHVGTNAFYLEVRDRAGALTEVTGLDAIWTQSGHTPQPLAVRNAGPGHYLAPVVPVATAGPGKLTVTVRTSETTQTTVTLPITVN